MPNKNSATPIVFIHNKKSNFMAPVIAQAKHSNPGSDIYIISELNAEEFFSKHGTFVNIRDYFAEAETFEKIYKHLSSMDYKLELIWLQRWFVLKNFMLEKKIERLVYLDSDCMLYSNVDNEWSKFAGYDFATLDILCPAVTYVTGTASLVKFCQFLNEQYTIRLSMLEERYQKNFVALNLPGGIGDMSQFSMYGKMYNTIYDVSREVDGTTYDSNMNTAENTSRGIEIKPLTEDEKEGYVLDEITHVKKITMQGGMPYGILKATGKKVMFRSLHFQGTAKQYIPKYFTGGFIKKLLFIRAAKLEKQALERKRN